MHSRLVLLVAVAVAMGAGADVWAVNSANPIPAPITMSGLSAELVDVVQLPNTSFNTARVSWAIDAGDGSGRLFVVDSLGRIWIEQNGALLPDPFVNLNNLGGGAFLSANSQQGVRSIAFHPDFANSGTDGFGKVYVAAALTSSSAGPNDVVFGLPPLAVSAGITTPDHDDAIIEWQVTTNPNQVQFNTGRIVLRVSQPLPDHNMDLIAFNPNAKPGDDDYGNLYVGLGDGGNTLFGCTVCSGKTSEFETAQDLSLAHGSILRINPLEDTVNNMPYSVPADNPFVDEPGALDEIWAYGLRNPERFWWDTPVEEGGTGLMLIGDIGQAKIEEVNIGIAGANYGWPDREGMWVTNRFNENLLSDVEGDDDYTYPAAMYDHDEGNAMMGGFVYRGSIPQLRGKYIFGDLVNGRVFYVEADELESGNPADVHELTLTVNGVPKTLQQLVNNSRADLRYGIDENGELYVMTKTDGMVRMFLPRIPGDFDNDGDVDLDDYNIISGNMYTTDAEFDDGDANFDGLVNFEDFVIMALHFGETQDEALGAIIPEPGAVWLLLTGASLLRTTRRYR